MTTCRCTAPQMNLQTSCPACCPPLCEIQLSYMDLPCWARSSFTRELWTYFIPAKSSIFPCARHSAQGKFAGIRLGGVCYISHSRNSQNESREKHYCHRNVCKAWPYLSLMLMHTKTRFILWNRRSLLLLRATYHAGFQDEASTNSVAESASLFPFHLVWVSPPAHHFKSVCWPPVFAAEQNEEVTAECTAGTTVPSETQQGLELAKNQAQA